MALAAAAPVKVFISYSSLDRAEAFQLLRLLELEGCTVWLDFCDIKPGEVVGKELEVHVGKADVLCVLMSPTSAASQWVDQEMRLALGQRQRGLRIVPVILRSCKVPELLAEFPYVDARDGIPSAAAHLTRMVAGGDSDGRTGVLSEGERAAIAKKELREAADRQFPALARELDRIRGAPIREISLTIDPATFPGGARLVIELQLVLNPLWTVPMSFYFAQYREGATWPEGFGFSEPPYTSYFLNDCPRVDCKFRWFDRIEEPVQTMPAVELPDRPAEFTLALDGAEFQPKSGGPHVPQKFEIPSLQKLKDDRSHFRLIAHDPETRTAAYLDQDPTDLDITVTARFSGMEPQYCRLYQSRHSQQELNLFECQSLAPLESAIEREALLSLYPIAGPAGERERKQQLRQSIEKDEPVAEEDRRLAARLAFGEAQLAVVRGQHLRALQLFQKTALLLQPLVLESYPTLAEGALMYRACQSLVGYFLQTKQYQRAADFVNAVGLVAQRLLEIYPEEPDHRRLWADALLRNAIVHAENGDTAAGARELKESVDTWRELAAELPNPERQADARKAFATAIDYASRWKIEGQLPLEEWRSELDPAGHIERAVGSERAKRETGPAWLQPLAADPKGWPTVPFESPLLRYALRIPKRWPPVAEVRPVSQMETSQVLRGPRAAEWLIVSFMDKATPGGRMTMWVDAVARTAGFPVLEMIGPAGEHPELLDWHYEGSFEAVAQRLQADQAHGYTGVAQLPGKPPLLARLYILLAGRGSFAWKVTLAFETACPPGMPADRVAAEDHIRAAAVLGALRLG